MLALLTMILLADGARAPVCFETARDVAAGSLLSPDDVQATSCRGSKVTSELSYDAVSRTMATASALPAGAYLGRLPEVEARLLPTGTQLTLRAVYGPAIVERQVTTLQPGRAGQKVFVRDTDGNVFAAMLRTGDMPNETR